MLGQNCDAIKAELVAAQALLDKMIAPGVRAVRDSDGSSIEYTLGNYNAQREKVSLLQARYDACLSRCNRGPLRPIF